MRPTSIAEAFDIAGQTVNPGTKVSLEIPVARLPSGTWMSLPVTVVHGQQSGACVWVCSTVHGDELNGIETIRRVLDELRPRAMSGTVIAVPVVNVFGMITQSRYLPDRRDLNRSFPGSRNGSLAARLAHRFTQEIAAHCEVGIDLHTGSDYRENLPQIRADLEDPETRRLAGAFGAPIMMHAPLRGGSLREAATSKGARVLLYEGGEALRFSEYAIAMATDGVLRTLAALGMGNHSTELETPSMESKRSRWIRARRGGVLRTTADLGERVCRGDTLGFVTDPSGGRDAAVRAPRDGLMIGISRNPLVHQGDAVFHIADVEAAEDSADE